MTAIHIRSANMSGRGGKRGASPAVARVLTGDVSRGGQTAPCRACKEPLEFRTDGNGRSLERCTNRSCRLSDWRPITPRPGIEHEPAITHPTDHRQGGRAPRFDLSQIKAAIVDGTLTRERACDGKARFNTYAKAQRARDKWAAADPEPTGSGVDVYACPFCSGFHLGHPPRDAQRLA